MTVISDSIPDKHSKILKKNNIMVNPNDLRYSNSFIDYIYLWDEWSGDSTEQVSVWLHVFNMIISSVTGECTVKQA